ncbi:hypothetical protein [Neorhodopirellula pilleata]|uniref:Uncharacterized protein n=1 Tax=Neorhodopirellula pilleata TaxID=2714738 RepID=A0A5C6A2P7_9BACT|nr:hypothetical protein [Neorhodopirellula pilleata]TWT93587.1 hypothetical protein Pla100_41050 [Neorhodopirellula pilleata]
MIPDTKIDFSFDAIIGQRLFMLGVGLVLATIAGCGIDADSLATLEQAARQHVQMSQGIDGPATSPVSLSPSGELSFQPAFPERRDPFRVDQTEVERDEMVNVSSDIRVIGFAKLGQQQAILKIGDESKFVIVGDRIGDVEILGISPPRVRLRSGNLTWDASMFQNSMPALSGAVEN